MGGYIITTIDYGGITYWLLFPMLLIIPEYKINNKYECESYLREAALNPAPR